MKLEYVGICGSDLHDYEKGTIDDFVVEPPFVLGHEPDGAIVLVGYSRTGEMTLPTDHILNKELTLKSIFRYRHIYPTAIEVVASGKINLKGIVSDIFPLSDIQHAMDESVRNKADIVKAVIKIEE